MELTDSGLKVGLTWCHCKIYVTEERVQKGRILVLDIVLDGLNKSERLLRAAESCQELQPVDNETDLTELELLDNCLDQV